MPVKVIYKKVEFGDVYEHGKYEKLVEKFACNVER